MGERSRGLNSRGRLSQEQSQIQSDSQTLSLDPDPDPPDPDPKNLPLGALQQGSGSSRSSRPGPQKQTPSGTTPYAPITNNMSDDNVSSATQQVIESVHIQSLSPPLSSNSRATPPRISSIKSSLSPASANNLASASINSTRSRHEPSNEFQRQQPLSPPPPQPPPPEPEPESYNLRVQNSNQNYPQDIDFPIPQEEGTGAEMGQRQSASGASARSRSRSRSMTRYDNPTNMDMEQGPLPVPIPPPENINRSRRTSLVVPKIEDGYTNYGLLPNAGAEDALLRIGGQIQAPPTQPGRYNNYSNNSSNNLSLLNQNQMRRSQGQEGPPMYAQMGPGPEQQQDMPYGIPVPVGPVPEMRMRPGMDQDVRLPYNINGNGNLGPRGPYCPYPFSEEHWDPIALQVPCPCPFCPLPQLSGPGPLSNRMAQGQGPTVQPGDGNYGQGLYPLTFNRSYTGEQDAENLNGGGFGLTRQLQNHMQLQQPLLKQSIEPLDLYHNQNQNNFNLNQGQSERFYYDVDPNNQSLITQQQQQHQLSGMYHQQQQQQQQQYEPFQNQNPMTMMQTPCNLCSCPMCQSQNQNNGGGRYCQGQGQPPKQSQPQLCLVDPADPGGAIIPVQIVMADDRNEKASIQQKMSHPLSMLKKRKRSECLYSLKNSYNNGPERPSSQYPHPPQNPNPFQCGNLLGGQLNDMNNNNTNNNEQQQQPQMTLIREVFKFQKLPQHRPPPSSWSSKSVACRPPWTQSFKYSPSKPKFLFLDNTENKNLAPQLPLCYMCSPSPGPGPGPGPGGPCSNSNNKNSKGLTSFPFPCSSPIPEYKCRSNSDASGSMTCKQMTMNDMDMPSCCCCCSCCQCKRQRQQQQQQQQQQRCCKSSRQNQKMGMGVCVHEKQAQCPEAQCFQSQSSCPCQCPCPCMKRTVVCVKAKVKGDCVIVKKPKLCCGPTSFVREFVLASPECKNQIQTDQGCLTNNSFEIEPNTFPDAGPCACRCRCCRFQCNSFNCSNNGNNDFNSFNTNPQSINITGMEDSINLSFNESNNNENGNGNSNIKRTSRASASGNGNVTGTGTGKSEKSSSKRNSNASSAAASGRTGIESNNTNNNNTGKNGDQDSLESFDVSTTMNGNYKATNSFDSQNKDRSSLRTGTETNAFKNVNGINGITPDGSITEIIINPVPDPDPANPQGQGTQNGGSKKSSLSKNSPKQSPKTSVASSAKDKSPRSSLLQNSLSSKEQIKSIKRKKSSGGGGGSNSFSKDESGRGSGSRRTSKSKNNFTN